MTEPTVESMLEKFFADALAEAKRAIRKFPQPNLNTIALTEEVGELSQAIMDEPARNVWAEATQVAAMAGRVAVEGDPSVDTHRTKKNLDGLGAAAWAEHTTVGS